MHKDMFARAGLDTDKASATWHEVLSAAAKRGNELLVRFEKANK